MLSVKTLPHANQVKKKLKKPRVKFIKETGTWKPEMKSCYNKLQRNNWWGHIQLVSMQLNSSDGPPLLQPQTHLLKTWLWYVVSSFQILSSHLPFHFEFIAVWRDSRFGFIGRRSTGVRKADWLWTFMRKSHGPEGLWLNIVIEYKRIIDTYWKNCIFTLYKSCLFCHCRDG